MSWFELRRKAENQNMQAKSHISRAPRLPHSRVRDAVSQVNKELALAQELLRSAGR